MKKSLKFKEVGEIKREKLIERNRCKICGREAEEGLCSHCGCCPECCECRKEII